MFCSRTCARSGKFNPAFKHGNSKRSAHSKEYSTWTNIKTRCLNPNRDNTKYYKDNGITMCDRWLNDFSNFLEDIGKCPSSKHSIDRIDNSKGYEPGNVRWATRLEQANNKSSNRFLEYDGQRLTLAEWGRNTGIKDTIIWKRLSRGWSIERTLTTPVKST